MTITSDITNGRQLAPAGGLADLVRQEIARAASAGEPKPGRPALAKLTGATDHQVRKVLATLAEEDRQLEATSASTAPAPDASTEQTATSGTPAQVNALATTGDADTKAIASTPPGPPAAQRLVSNVDALVNGWRRWRPAGDQPRQEVASDHQKPVSRWWTVVLAVVAVPAFVATWSGWVGLGGLTGFGKVRPLPGIWDSLVIDTAVTLPLGIEAYAFLSVGMWLSGTLATRGMQRFAMWSGLFALTLGMGAQVAYHLIAVDHGVSGANAAPWGVVVAVACLPNTVLGMASILIHGARKGAAR